MGTAGIVGAAGIATSGRASAQEQRKVEEAKKQYNSPSSIKEALTQHAGDLMKELSSRNLIESPLAKDLNLESKFSSEHELRFEERLKREQGAYVSGVNENGVYTAHIVIAEQTPTHSTEIFVQPQRDHSYAFVEPKSEDEGSYILDSSLPDTDHEGSHTTSQSGPITQDLCRREGCECGQDCAGAGNDTKQYKLVYCRSCTCYRRVGRDGCCNVYECLPGPT